MKGFIQTIKNIWSIKELKEKLILTFLLILVYRFGSYIPLPGVDINEVNRYVADQASASSGILGLLNYGDMTGYDLMKIFEKSLHYFWHVKTSQIYLELDNMTKSGLVVFRKEIQESRPNKNIFMMIIKFFIF